MQDGVGPALVSNVVSGAVLLAMHQGDLKEIVLTQVGSLEILLGEITNLC